MKTRYWIFAIAALLLLSLVLSVLLLPRGQALRADIYSDGKLLKTVQLWEEESFTVTSADGGSNVITVRGGKLAVTEADCPDQICVDMGFCSAGQIVCLPHKLVIRFAGNAAVDAVSR